jgi:Xaa-Pro dipeptidase
MDVPLLGSGIPEPVVREHIARLAALMQANDVAATVIFHPANLLAFVGTDHGPTDRLSCALITNEGHVLHVCPFFEQPAIAAQTSLPEIITWTETQNPYQVLADAAAGHGIRSGALAVDGRMWLSAYDAIESAFSSFQLIDGEPLLREVRICKTPFEIELMRLAHRRGERVFEFLKTQIIAGKTEREIRDTAGEHFLAEGFAVAPYVQTGPMAAIPHHSSDNTPLEIGHTVVVDSVTTTARYFNDLTRTYAIGEPPQRAKQAYAAVRAAQQAAIQAARPGATCGSVDAAARQVIEDAGFGEYFIHRLGHGLGLEVHEPPYFVGGNDEVLRTGMVLTVEPGIYVPGEFGIRIEDDITITEDACEVIAGDLATDVTTAFDS